MLHFVVEKLGSLTDNSKYIDYVCTTPACSIVNNTPNYWGNSNKIHLIEYIKTDNISLIDRKNYVLKNDSFYLIVIKNDTDVSNFMSYLNDEIINFLKETNIPILLWYPFDMCGTASRTFDIIDSTTLAKRYNLQNKIVLLSLSNYRDKDYNPISFKTYDNSLENVKWVQSLAFVSLAKINELKNPDVSMQSVDEHKIENKKYNFLCLNKLARPSRELLLQALYQNKHLWDNNIISCNFDTPSDINFISNMNYFLYNDGSYFKNKEFDFKLSKTKEIIPSFLRHTSKEEFYSFLKKFISFRLQGNTYSKRQIDDTRDGMHYSHAWFKETLFSLITETFILLQNRKFFCEIPMITEKTTKAILNYHPFIILGHSFSHRQLNDLGFKTFEYLINFPKDDEIGNNTLLERIYNLINALNNFDITTCDFEKTKIHTEHNYNHLMSTDWLKLQCEYIKYKQY